nr:NAD(P)(+) transhydrogenase (Re/Si-specific) subunit alpha [Actinomycetota bacterium]
MSSPQLKVVIPAEKRAGEARVATVPDVVGKLVRAGVSVEVESGAGAQSQATDEDFRKAGATVSSGVDLASADVVISVNALEPAVLAKLKKGALTISFLSPTASLDSISAAKNAGVTAFSLELVPRISRAQSMDALTSQALCAGYRAALVAAELSPRFFPLLMTAAGTVTPANVIVL